MTTSRSHDTLSAREAAALLGIKLSTLYAYVSRGKLQSTLAPDGRGKRYLRADVERLKARKGRPEERGAGPGSERRYRRSAGCGREELLGEPL